MFEAVGEGFDTLDYSGVAANNLINLSDARFNSAELEKVVGSDFSDTIIGDAEIQEVAGGDGNDTYRFNTNFRYEDVLILEQENGGIDTLDFSLIGQSQNVDLRNEPNIENVIGTDFDDVIIGNSRDNAIYGGAGDDFIEGRLGDDQLEGEQGVDTYNVITGEVLGVTDVVNDDASSVFLPGRDADGDGIYDDDEITIGTDPNEFDTDGDLLGDGFENGSGSLNPTQQNDPQGDSDGDGLTELQEQIYGTNPDSNDSDGDGTSDLAEVQQGSDPNDSDDDGIEPRFEDISELVLTVGDPSTSESERYDLQVGPVFHQAPQFGVVESGTYTFKRGKKYDVEITHRGSNLQDPDYDYTAGIGLPPGHQSLVVLEDPQEILTTDYTSDYFFARGKKAYVYLPQVDLDVITVDGSEVPDDKEDTTGGYLQPVPVNSSSSPELTELKIHKVFTPIAGASTLWFNGSEVRVWKDRNRTQRVFPRSTEFSSDSEHTVFVESLLPTDAYRALFVRAVFEIDAAAAPFTVLGDNVEDRIKLITLAFDLDIDSNNDDGFALPQNDAYSEELEDNDYAIGKLVFKSSNLIGENDPEIVNQFTPVVIRLAAGIDTANSDLKVRFEFEPNVAGVFHLWTRDKGSNPIDLEVGNGGDRIFIDGEYDLDDLNYDPVSGNVVFYIDGKDVSPGTTLDEWEKAIGQTKLSVKATLLIDDGGSTTEVLTDEVKFLVVKDRHFVTAMQQRVAVQGELVSRGVYGGNTDVPFDLMKFGHKRLSETELKELGVGDDAIQLLYNEEYQVTPGFKAALYQNFLAPEDNTFVVAFAGTDASGVDVVEDIRQGLGLSAPQYASAVNLAVLVNDIEGIPRLSFAGHSLGGGLASAASVVTGNRAYTFNAAGLSRNTLLRRNAAGEVLEINGRNLEIVPGSLARYDNPLNLINAYYVDYDALSRFQDIAPGVPSAIGTRIPIDGPYDRAMAGIAVAGVVSSYFSLGVGGAIATNVAGATVMVNAHLGNSVLHGLLVDEVVGIDLLGYYLGTDYPVLSGE